MRLARKEVFAPIDPTNQATESMCVKLCQVWAKGMREGMHSTPQKEHLSSEDGKYSTGKITQRMREDLAASDPVNDMCERAFAMFTHTLLRNGNIGHSSASAMASGKMNGNIVATTVVTAGKKTGSHSKGISPAKEALLDTLPEKEAMALFEYARTGVKAFKAIDDREVQSQLADNLKSFKERAMSKLNLTADKFARALEFHRLPRIRTVRELRDALKKEGSEKQKLDLLKQQLNIVVHGYGWDEFKTAWSCAKDKYVGSLKDLQTKTEAMIEKSGEKDAPAEPPVPLATKTMPSLGTLTLQSIELLNRKRASAGELRVRAQAMEAERAAAAASKLASLRDKHAYAQPDEAPAIKVGMHLEIYTMVEDEDADGNSIEYKQWLAVEVVSSAALSNAKSKGPKGAMRAPDWFLVKYECDGMEEWLRLKEFNCNSKGSWRLDLDYLGAEGASSSAESSGAQEEPENSEAESSESDSEAESSESDPEAEPSEEEDDE